ncbi:MAG TPA: hypothetical protein VNS32_09765, partial [Flavisolibacter sp.]|nr:hypothetical protein [Flavisolibacter sp.]
VSNNNPASGQQNSVPEIKAPAQNNQLQNEQPQVAVTNSATYAGSSQDNKENDVTNLPSQMQGQIAIRDHKNTTTEGPDDGSVYKHLSRPSDAIQGQMASEPIASIDLQKQSINNSPVTTALQKRNTNTEPDPNNPEIEGPVTYAPSQKSGSLRGFLRKATRVIEKRTGIASTSDDDGEILIGALAVKVK